MKQLQLLLHDRRRRQRGSVLSALLIIVAFLSILIGALLTELTDSFIVSRELVARAGIEATATSAVELAINQLQAGPVPPVCAQDTSANPSPPRPETWSLASLNGHPATVSQTCKGILPEVVKIIAPGSFTVDGVRDTLAGRNRYLVSDASGSLAAFPFGQTQPSWPAVSLEGTPTAPLLTAMDPDGSVDILAPVAANGSGCASPCVVLLHERNGFTPTIHCNLSASSTVSARPGAGANFPGYAYFGDSGHLYVYDARFSQACAPPLQAKPISGLAAGAVLVFPGRDAGDSKSDEIFVLVTSSSGTSLQHWRYTETVSEGGGSGSHSGNQAVSTSSSLIQVSSQSLNGSNAVGYGLSSAAPPLSLAVATASGWLDIVRISTGPSYSMSTGASAVLPNGATTARAPYWCRCPGQDLIGVGGSNGSLYLLDIGLNVAYSYDGQTDGRPAINTTPMADSNGEWYFGANDGSIYDVEIPLSGAQMFKAARFGPGGAIASSPIVGTCTNGPCMYYGSSSAGNYFARIGSTRVSELRACVSSGAGSTTCAANPRLWARVQVGPGGIWGGSGVFVQGWSFYSP